MSNYIINICYKKTIYTCGFEEGWYEEEPHDNVYIDCELSPEITNEMIEWRGNDAYVDGCYLDMYAREEIIKSDAHTRVIEKLNPLHGIIVLRSSRFKLLN